MKIALERLAAAQTSPTAASLPEHAPTPTKTPPMAVVVGWAIALLTLAGLGIGVTRAAAAESPSTCKPITYTVLGSPPDHALAELDLAVQEIHRHSGLVFAKDAGGTAKLRITWSGSGVASGSSSPAVSDQRATRLLGYGEGLWLRADGASQLVAGKVVIDATAAWPLGLGSGNSLAAVFAHELGHVIGLDHSSDPTSFMYKRVFPEAPHWTAEDLVQLEQAGRDTGCRLPSQSGSSSEDPASSS